MKTCPTCQGSYPNDYAVCPQDGSTLEDVGIWTEGGVIRGKYRILSKVGQEEWERFIRPCTWHSTNCARSK